MGFRHTLIALFAFVSLALPGAASAAGTPALVFSHVTTQRNGSGTVERGGLYAARGERVSQLTHDPADAEPAFSPDGDTIAFVRGGDLFTTRPDGTGERALTGGPEVDSRPLFSADGRTIVFERRAEPGAPRDLYAIGAGGGGLRALVRSSEDEHEASLSPRGKTVAFVRSEAEASGGTRDRVFSVRLNGTGLARLSRGAGDAFAPHYFAAGIVFDRGESSEGPSGFSDIYAMKANGSSPRKLVGGASSVYLEDVSADGRTMLFSRYESLCEKPIAGGSPHKLGPLPDDVEAQALFSPSGGSVAIRTESYDADAPSAPGQRLYLLDVRRGFELGDLASADESGDLPSEIGAGFAWQPVARAAY
jgi:dipeptidyl aminopeptidase/acylaminoacyl peptidase